MSEKLKVKRKEDGKKSMIAEKPDTIHGRLLEAIHISGYTFERACKEFIWLLEEDRWKSIGNGFDDINDFLSTIDFSEYKILVDQRKNIARKLRELEATQRATARMLGVSNVTIKRDMDVVTNVTNGKEKANEIKGDLVDVVTNVTAPAEIAQSGLSAAQSASKSAIKEEAIKQTKQRREESQNATPLKNGMDYRVGEAKEVLSDIKKESVHLIITDPPYGDKAEPLYIWLAAWSEKVLIDGGSLICFTGQSRLDRDIEIFGKKLRYWWLLAMRHNQAQRLPGKFVMAEFKPVLWFVKKKRIGRTLVNDILRSDGRDKKGHDWGQGDGGVELLIQQLSNPDELIVDPFAGTGKWGEIAARMGRRWIGSDIKDGGSTNIKI